MKQKRIMVSLGEEAGAMIKHVQEVMQGQVPKHLVGVKISKCLVVETALKKYVEQLESIDEEQF